MEIKVSTENILPIIRDATLDDIPSILDIYNDAILNTTAVYTDIPHTLDMRIAWYEDRIKNNFPVIVITLGTIVVGFGSYGSFRTFPGYRYTIEHSIYIDKRYRGYGYSKLLLERLINLARSNNYHVMIAAIDASNEISIQLHRKYGFEEIGIMKQVGFKFNRWLDALFMQLVLDTTIDHTI